MISSLNLFNFSLFIPLLDLESFVENVSDETFLHSDNIDSGVYSSLAFFGPIPVAVRSKALGLRSLGCWDRGFESR